MLRNSNYYVEKIADEFDQIPKGTLKKVVNTLLVGVYTTINNGGEIQFSRNSGDKPFSMGFVNPLKNVASYNRVQVELSKIKKERQKTRKLFSKYVSKKTSK